MEFRPGQHAAGGNYTPAHTGRKGRSLKNMPRQMMLWLIVVILFIIAIGTAAYFVNRYNESQKEVKRLSNPTEAAKSEQQQLISKVGALTDLPKNETPTVATVTDISKLKGQAFFTNAQNGDKVLIYTGAKKAYLYRPSTNKIINIAPVNLGSGNKSGNSGTTNTTQTTTPTTNTTTQP